MARSLLPLLLLLSSPSLIFAMRAAHLPRSAQMPHISHHSAYISNVMHPVQELLMNHEDWYKRKCTPIVEGPNATFLSPTTLTISVVPVPATTTNSADLSMLTIPHASTAAPVNTSTPIALYQAPPSQAFTTEAWDISTDNACTNSLANASSFQDPSGMTACYNIRTFIASNNIFEADLRIYQVSLMTGEWKGIESKDMSVGIKLSSAEVKQADQSSQKMRKRDERPAVATAGNVWTGQGGGGASWGGMRRKAIADSIEKPRRIGTLRLQGTIDATAFGQSMTLQDALTPAIRLSAARQDGTILVANLSSTKAFFVIGLFAPVVLDKPGVVVKRIWPPDIGVVIREGNRLEVGLVLPLVVACVFAMVPTLVEGWGIWIRWKCRREWRGRMKRGEGNGVVFVNYY